MQKGRISKVLWEYGPSASSRVFVTFPFAGGAADLFKDWCFLADMPVLSCQYRGRFPDGLEDEILLDIDAVAEDMCVALESKFKEATTAFFYGHSYGALIGWLVAAKLQEKKSCVQVKHLFVGAEASPSRPEGGNNEFEKMSIEEFAKHLVHRGMLKAASIQNADASFYNLMKPTWSEFHLDNSFQLSKLKKVPEKLRCGITAFYEAEDDSFGLRVEDVETWQEYTDAEFECIPVYGPHLFMLEQHNEAELLEMIKERLTKE